ncbi:MAG TPA: peptidoglycan editing factor PgeF [Terriglobia bacterium]|nr:peptidoglycan editing factor PgeF [Terriglobia bacterium]
MPSPSHRATQRLASHAALVLRIPSLAEIPWLVHGFSTRLGGVSEHPFRQRPAREMNLGPASWDVAANVEENRRRLLAALRAEGMRLAVQNQIHSDLIRSLSERSDLAGNARGDGMITKRKGILLGILAADCFPLLLVDVRQKVVGAFHCGWRGTVRRIAQKGVGQMRQRYGCRPQDLRAALGPGIRACCYRVGEDVAAEFESQFHDAASLLRIDRPQKKFMNKHFALLRSEPWRGTPAIEGREIYLDLAEAIIRQLEAAGLCREQIHSCALCTSCSPDLFFSHRRDAGRTGRMMGVIGIRS